MAAHRAVKRSQVFEPIIGQLAVQGIKVVGFGSKGNRPLFKTTLPYAIE
jgi:hypothetical protein